METLKGLAAAAALACSTPAIAGPVDLWTGPVAEASARFGLPAAWIRRGMREESGGHVMHDGRPIVSRAGAMGLMQLMPGTWSDMRVALGLGDDPFDPHDNILAGAFYLRLLYDRFGYPGLFAAYHAGPARYAAALSGQRPLPLETRRYLLDVAGASPAPTPASLRQPSGRPGLFALSAADPLPPGLPAGPASGTGDLFIPLGGRAGQ